MVDYGYYITTYCGEPIDGETFKRLAVRSHDIIMSLTGNVTETDDIKKAQCAEIEFLSKNGGVEATAGNDKSQFVSESIGGYSYSRGNSNSATSSIQYINGLPIAPMVWTYIRRVGVVRGME